MLSQGSLCSSANFSCWQVSAHFHNTLPAGSTLRVPRRGRLALLGRVSSTQDGVCPQRKLEVVEIRGRKPLGTERFGACVGRFYIIILPFSCTASKY